ncbi:MAG: hypothetical protein HY000_17090 [Planctomycetes bacterium]|nr:hypothetical protein [Planctomycetota bacterium]
MRRDWYFLCASPVLLALAVGCSQGPGSKSAKAGTTPRPTAKATELAEAGTKTIELSVPMH